MNENPQRQTTTTTMTKPDYQTIEEIIETPPCTPDDCYTTAVCYIHFLCKCSDVFPFCAGHRDLIVSAARDKYSSLECRVCHDVNFDVTVHPFKNS